MLIPFTKITYTHSGYCSSDDNAIEIYNDTIDYESIELLITDLLNNTNNIVDKMDLSNSTIENYNSCTQLQRITNSNICIIKYTIYDGGSGYCGDMCNHNDFIDNKYYYLIKNMKVNDGYLIIE